MKFRDAGQREAKKEAPRMLPLLAQQVDTQNPDLWVTTTLYLKIPTKWVTGELANHPGAPQEWNSKAGNEARPTVFRSEVTV